MRKAREGTREDVHGRGCPRVTHHLLQVDVFLAVNLVKHNTGGEDTVPSGGLKSVFLTHVDWRQLVEVATAHDLNSAERQAVVHDRFGHGVQLVEERARQHRDLIDEENLAALPPRLGLSGELLHDLIHGLGSHAEACEGVDRLATHVDGCDCGGRCHESGLRTALARAKLADDVAQDDALPRTRGASEEYALAVFDNYNEPARATGQGRTSTSSLTGAITLAADQALLLVHDRVNCRSGTTFLYRSRTAKFNVDPPQRCHTSGLLYEPCV